MTTNITPEMITLLKQLSDLANQCSDEIYDDNDLKHGTAGILTLCDQLTTKIDTYLEHTESEE